MKKVRRYSVVVGVDYADYENSEPPMVSALAKKFRVKLVGGGMLLSGKKYEHHYVSDTKKSALNFFQAVSDLGYFASFAKGEKT